MAYDLQEQEQIDELRAFWARWGNVILGVPFRLGDDMRIYYDGSFFGLLTPFALLCGLVSLFMLMMHGAAWLVFKTEGEVAARAARWGAIAAVLTTALFALDENKRVKELSEGMKVKYALALALSHRARLLVLDEPTSGLDPVSRDELLEIFLQLAQDEGISILFSTHITSDLEKCADHIVYLRQGEVAADADADALRARYRTAALTAAQRDAAPEGLLLGCKREREGFSALLRAEDAPRLGADTAPASLEDIMVHLEKEDGGL